MSKSLKTLPPNYVERARFSLQSRGMLLIMNLIGLGLVLVSVWLFTALALYLRPEAGEILFVVSLEGAGALLSLLGLLLIIAVTLVLHEAVHGLGFWLLAGAKPHFAFRGTYAYAAAPGWYIPKEIYFWIGIAPLVVISLLAAGLIAVVPVGALNAVILAGVINFSGAVGDLWVALMLLRAPKGSLALDQGDEMILYAPAPSIAG